MDHLVRDVVGPLANRLVAERHADRWFFVRYADPHDHLRVRFQGGAVLPVVQAAVAPLVEDGRIWKVQLDTYEREVERYGGDAGIGPCEDLFHLDSAAAVELLGALGDDGRADRRWRIALLAMDRLLDDLRLDLEGKLAVARASREALRADSRTGVEAVARVGAKYRAESKALAALFEGEGWEDARAVLDRRSLGAAPAVAALRRGAVDVEGLAGSLLHMHCNRLLRSAQTAQEMVLHDFLCRGYEGLLARGAPQRTA
jgi:thiopeptide-type bacteriocin biosynthesis protein